MSSITKTAMLIIAFIIGLTIIYMIFSGMGERLLNWIGDFIRNANLMITT